MLAFRPTALMLALLALSSCAYAPGGTGFPWGMNFSGVECKDDSSQFLEGVDWHQARVLDIRIRQGHFSPTFLGLYVGQPYILSIENADDADHSFRAFDFFRAVAVAGVSEDGADFQEVDCLAGVTIPPRMKTALRFVAIRDGTYEFDDDSIVNSLAMIGSGGGFITIEPRRRIIESPLKHLNLFDHKSVEIKAGRAKPTEPDDGAVSLPAPDSSLSELPDDPKNTYLDQPSSVLDGPVSEQPIDPAPSQPVAISPLFEVPPSEGLLDAPSETPVADKATKTPVVLEDEPERKIFIKREPVVEETPVTPAIVKNLSQPDAPEAMPEGFQLLEGPQADVYSDPPDGVKTQTYSGGDGGEDKLGSSG